MRVTKKRRLDLLGSVWLFEQCTQRELGVLDGATSEMHCVVIVEGEVEVTRDGTRIAVLGPGACLGEMSLLDGKPRTATATTVTPTHVLMLTATDFDEVLTTMPSVDRKLLTVLAGRLREIEERYVPANDRGARTVIV